MFNNEFTFGTSVGSGINGQSQTVFDNHINEAKKVVDHGIYKKVFYFRFEKILILKKNTIGLGDVVDFITTYTGIKWFLIKVTKGNCGCEKRRILFNSWLKIPYISITFRNLTFNDIHTIVTQNNNTSSKVIKPIQEMPKKKGCGCANRKK